MALNFVAIDFEAANHNRASVCAIGMARVEDGRVTARQSLLIKPHVAVGRFDRFAVQVHGIDEHAVADAPEWDEAYGLITAFLGDLPVAAHNADYDLDVLRAACERYGLPSPELSFFCTLRIARSVLPGLPSYKLLPLAQSVGIDTRNLNAHDAGDDALMTALLAVHTAKIMKATSVAEMTRRSGTGLHPLSGKRRKNMPALS